MKKQWKIFASIVIISVFLWDLSSNILFLEKIGFEGFERGNDMVNFINSVSGKDTLLFGDDSVTPLLALMTNKEIALNFVDTNNEVFASGIRNLKGVLAELKGKDVLFIIRDRQGISYFDDAREFLNRNCGLLSQFHDKMEGSYLIYKCK